MTTILKGGKLVTFINIFTVGPANQRRMRKDQAPLPYLREALTIATFEPGTYEVVETFAAGSE